MFCFITMCGNFHNVGTLDAAPVLDTSDSGFCAGWPGMILGLLELLKGDMFSLGFSFSCVFGQLV